MRAVRFSVDGNYCMTAGQDKNVKLWNPNKGRSLKTYSGHGYEVLDVKVRHFYPVPYMYLMHLLTLFCRAPVTTPR